MSRNVNSKLHFAEHAPKRSAGAPHRSVFQASDSGGEADRLFSELPNGVMVKLLGWQDLAMCLQWILSKLPRSDWGVRRRCADSAVRKSWISVGGGR